MQSCSRFPTLVGRHPIPVGTAGFARRRLAGTRRNPMEDGPIQVFVDDLVFGGHGPQPLAFNAILLSDQLRGVAFDRQVVLNGNAA